MVEKHDRINPNNVIINQKEILAIHKGKLQELREMVMEAACDIENQPNLWKALQHPSSKAYLEAYSRQNPGSDYIEVIKSYLTQGDSNNYVAAIDLLIKILHTSAIQVGQNGIKSITPIPQKRGSKNKNITDNELIRAKLDQIRSHLNGSVGISSDEECLTPTLWILINTENNLERIQEKFVMEQARVASQRRKIRKAEQLRNRSGPIGISILAVTYLAKFKYAELSYAGGSVLIFYALIQHAIYISTLRRLTKAKA